MKDDLLAAEFAFVAANDNADPRTAASTSAPDDCVGGACLPVREWTSPSQREAA